MTDGGPAEATPGARDDAAGGDTADERFAAIMRAPRRGALISGALVPLTAAVNLLLEDMSGLLFAGTVISAFVCALALWNVVNFSPRAITRLEALAPRVNGRFTLWKAGTGGLAGVPFAYGVDHQRFGLLSYVAHGMPIEIGHLSSQVSDRYVAPTGRLHAYAVVRLPERWPHMILSFGHLSRILGVRVAPDQWHRAQRLDVGLGRRARVFVADGGDQIARRLFDPETVQLVQRVGRFFDIELKDRNLYLFPSRPVMAGSERRWNAQRELVEELAASMAGSRARELVRRQNRGRGPGYAELRADLKRTGALVLGFAAVLVVVLSLIVINIQG
ncbi:MAG TPA: hypothetical protein VKY86_08500 [Promicromonospora sp.]|nr:hypothetical protein [Promicromonospora sp.]